MTARHRTRNDLQPGPTMTPVEVAARTIPASSIVMNIVVRAYGLVPVRLDLSHVGTPQHELSMGLGMVLVYVRSAITARAVAEQWGQAATHAKALSTAVVGRRPAMSGASTICAVVRLAGMPRVTAVLQPSRPGSPFPTHLRTTSAPCVEIADRTAYATPAARPAPGRSATRREPHRMRRVTSGEGAGCGQRGAAAGAAAPLAAPSELWLRPELWLRRGVSECSRRESRTSSPSGAERQ
jgi:hypothetical protein